MNETFHDFNKVFPKIRFPAINIDVFQSGEKGTGKNPVEFPRGQFLFPVRTGNFPDTAH
jgi:hypothetical protein